MAFAPRSSQLSGRRGPRPRGYASYTNYRYWPELLSSGLLPDGDGPPGRRGAADGRRAVLRHDAFRRPSGRLAAGRVPVGLWALGRENDFLLSLYGHVAYHQAEGHLTAYEQVTFPPGRKRADYCLPCQLVAARGARRINRLG